MKLPQPSSENAKSPAVWNTQDIYTADRPAVEKLKGAALADKGVYRLCLHDSPEAKLHQMLIALRRGFYFQPHKHHGKSESFHIVEGEMDVYVFDDSGKVTDVIEMGDFKSGKAFCYRLSVPRFHTVLPKSEMVVFHEITDGPFIREKTTFAPWAPDSSDAVAGERFVSGLKKG